MGLFEKVLITDLEGQFTFLTIFLIFKNAVQIVNSLHFSVQLKVHFEEEKLYIQLTFKKK